MKKFLFLCILLVLIHGFFGAVSASEPTSVSTLNSIGLYWSPDVSDVSCETPATVYDPADFDHVIDGLESTSTLSLDGHEWDNTLVRNCKIHDTGGDGIYIRNVRNVVVQGCEIWNVGSGESHRGVKVSGYGSTQDVVIDGNYIHDIPKSGIFSGQYSNRNPPTDHPGLRILNNRIERTGTDTSTFHHPIYIQSSDAYIEGNVITGSRGGNGISIRSSGVVRCNSVSGTSRSGKPGIRYFSDHKTGTSNLLLIENNTIVDDNVGIDLYKPVTEPDINSQPPDHIVKNFIVRYNSIVAPTPISVESDYNNEQIYNVQVYDNPMSSGGGSSSNECTVQYRESGSSVWKAGPALPFDDTDNEYKGSLVNLKPNTEYEIELSLQTGLKTTFTTKTLSDELPRLSPPSNMRIIE